MTVTKLPGLLRYTQQTSSSLAIFQPHHTLPYHISPHLSTPHLTTPQHATSHHTTLHHTTPHYTTPHHTTPHHTTPHPTTPHSTISQPITTTRPGHLHVSKLGDSLLLVFFWSWFERVNGHHLLVQVLSLFVIFNFTFQKSPIVVVFVVEGF